MSDVNKMVGEMRVQLRQQQGEFQRTVSSIDAVTRNNSVIEKSMQDIRSSGNDFVWEAVGRTFVKVTLGDYEKQLKCQMKDNIESLNVLNKKKHYLETSIKTTIDNLKQFVIQQ